VNDKMGQQIGSGFRAALGLVLDSLVIGIDAGIAIGAGLGVALATRQSKR
jgi:hypothetical protein